MKKRSLFLIIFFTLSIVIVAMTSYFLGYWIKGFKHANNTIAKTYCYILFIEAARINKLPDSPSVSELVDCMISNNEGNADFLDTQKMFKYEFGISTETNKMINKSLAMYEKAQNKLRKIKQLYHARLLKQGEEHHLENKNDPLNIFRQPSDEYVFRGDDLPFSLPSELIWEHSKEIDEMGQRLVIFNGYVYLHHVKRLNEKDFQKAIKTDNEIRQNLELPEKTVFAPN